MPRTISYAAHSEAFKQQTDKVFLVFMSIVYGGTTLRLVSNDANVDPGPLSASYIAFPFKAVFPDDSEGKAPTAQIQFDNTDRSIITILRSLQEPPIVTFYLTCADTPTVIEETYANMTMYDINYDHEKIIATLGFLDIRSEGFPAKLMDPTNCPGLFGLPAGTWG